MKEIPLTQGYVALVDDADFEAVNKFKWYYSDGYAARHLRASEDLTGRLILMHNQITGLKSIDHVEGNRANNQRLNLRRATKKQNNRAFRNKPPNASSEFRGVSRHRKSWVAQICISGRQTYLGSFNLEEDAARAYDTAARKHYREFAAPNFI